MVLGWFIMGGGGNFSMTEKILAEGKRVVTGNVYGSHSFSVELVVLVHPDIESVFSRVRLQGTKKDF